MQMLTVLSIALVALLVAPIGSVAAVQEVFPRPSGQVVVTCTPIPNMSYVFLCQAMCYGAEMVTLGLLIIAAPPASVALAAAFALGIAGNLFAIGIQAVTGSSC